MKTTIFVLICAFLGILLGVGLARARLGEAVPFVLPDADGAGDAGASAQLVPRVSVDQENFDFGHMERHTSQKHDFLFTNKGKAPLELKVGDTTCKCTVGEAPERLIQPGETVPVTLSWTAETDEPEFRQSATIHTNDPLRPTVGLSVVGKVNDASSYFPKTFLFGNVPLGTAQTAEVKIVSFRDETFEITPSLVAPASDEHFAVDVEPLPKEEYPTRGVQSGYRVTVTTKPSLPFGTIGGWLKIKTNLQSQAEMEVPLAGKVVSDFTIVGKGYSERRDLLDLGPVVGDRGAERKLLILLHGNRGKDVELTIGEASPDYLQAELGERTQVKEDLVQVPLVVRVRPGAPPAVHLAGSEGKPGRIVIRTTHPSVPEMVVNVQFTVE